MKIKKSLPLKSGKQKDSQRVESYKIEFQWMNDLKNWDCLVLYIGVESVYKNIKSLFI